MIEYDIERELKTKKGCFVCAITRKRMEERFNWFKLENYHEVSTLEELKNMPYICKKHKEALVKIGNSLSVTFDFLVRNDIYFFKTLLKINGKKLKKEIEKTRFNVCKFCEEEKKIELFIIETFVKMLDDENVRSLYKVSGGLCRNHLMQCLIEIGKDNEKGMFMIEDTLKRLYVTEKLFKTFFHKSDYRFTNEEKKEEQKAWLEAISFYSENK